MVPFGNFGWNFGVGFGWIIVVISFILIILAIVKLIRMKPEERRRTPRESGLDILKKRYARGEIDKNEFETKKKDLQQH